MTVRSNIHTLSTTREKIAEGGGAKGLPNQVTVIGASDANVRIGGADVDSTNGIPLATTTVIQFNIGPGDDLYAIATTGTPTVRTLTTGSGYDGDV
jgi:hypothetical protein